MAAIILPSTKMAAEESAWKAFMPKITIIGSQTLLSSLQGGQWGFKSKSIYQPMKQSPVTTWKENTKKLL